ESTSTNTCLWSLNTISGDLIHLDHSPSGDFHPSLDSFGRVIFTRWDHMQRDQQNRCSNNSFGAFNYASEASDAVPLDNDDEVFPEFRADCEITDSNYNLNNHSFNVFLPWQINEDGSEIETINHIGRHELTGYISSSFNDDPNVEEFYGQYNRTNTNPIDNFFQIHEDPLNPGSYFGINAPEFGTHAAGQIIKISLPPGQAPDSVAVTYVTHPDTDNTDETPSSDHIGLSRDPMPASDGSLIVSHSLSTLPDTNTGTSAAPQSRYTFRIKSFDTSGQYAQPGNLLTTGINKTISYWSPDQLVSYNNVTLWELQPKEIRSRNRPEKRSSELPAPEKASLEAAGVDELALRDYLKSNQLALIVGRNITTRDQLDHQQPLNLRVAGSDTESIKGSGKVYEVAHLQIFQGDLLRGYGGIESPRDGRRVIAQTLHSVTQNPANPEGPAGSVKIAKDGSFAALVPARRAVTYQLTDTQGTGVVRERLWLTFQPGEIRVCASCHGINSKDQKGNAPPENPPAALFDLVQDLQDGIDNVSPEMSLAITGGKTRKSKSQITIEIEGENASAAFKTVELAIAVGKKSCTERMTLLTDDAGNLSFTSAKMPGLGKKTRLNFSLIYGTTTLATSTYRLRPEKRNPVKKQRFCQAAIKALKKGKKKS
ncbi:MAG: hypothetical protein KDD62_08805, partial [Bdellovibrionales bacterium]|nr:hypothetical protein [Bdellovibrionales bacterium]